MRPISFIAVSIAFVAVFFFMPAAITHAAFGVSPPFVNADHLVPGSTFTQTIYLVRDNADQDVKIQASLQLADPIKNWVSFDQGSSFTIPAGMHQFPVTISVSVPKDAGLGIYHGSLTFNTAPASAGQVTIALGAQVEINLTIGNNVYENYVVQRMTFPDIYEGENPLVDVKFENDGNVPESFDSAVFELYDQYDTVRLAYVQKNDGFPTTPAFSVKDYELEFPIDFYMGVGQYWGFVTFYKNHQAVASQKTVFNVLRSDWWSRFIRYVAKEWIWLLIALVLLVGIVIAIVIRIRRSAAR
ncbi:MAG TPA: hypothetical protein VMU07_00570 [Candidatus Paceibacterota bacterium]|nr:hypothetical protein [Candidatus Paceibacterota bacterium]